MAITSTSTVSTSVSLNQNSGDGFPALTPSASFKPANQSYASGTSAGRIDLPYAKRITVASGSPISLDLSGGTMKTLLGDAANYARVGTLAFYNNGSNTVTLTGNFLTSSFGASFSMPLAPNSRFVYDNPSSTGLVVTNSTADTITLTASAGSNDVDVVVGGRSV